MAHLTVDSVSKSFVTPGGRPVQALTEVSFSLDRGQILAIVGHNGSGKTTLLNCIRGSLELDSGTIRIANNGGGNLPQRVVSVYQDVGLGVVLSMTAMENLALVQAEHGNGYLWSLPVRRYGRAIRDFLQDADLLTLFEAYEHTPVSELSGGQRQQLAIVMAMMREPSILLLDEFVASLDPRVKTEVLQLDEGWIRKRCVTALMVTHDHELAERWGDTVLELADGRVTRFSAAGRRGVE